MPFRYVTAYLVQEYIDGQNLAEELAENGLWNEITIREFLIGLLPVLQFIHDNNIIHRDIKPENIIKRRSDKAFVVVDFGISKYFTGTSLLKTGVGIGDPRYMPGEQLDGKAIFASDLYSLGLTCLHLLTNISPWELFDHDEQEWVWRDYLTVPISEGLGKVLDKMVLKATKKRFQSATEILAILQPLSVKKQPVPDSLKASSDIPSIPPTISQNINQSTQIKVDNKTKVASNHQPKISPVKTEVSPQIIPPKKPPVISNTDVDIELTPIKLGGYWGYMDKTGEVVIKPWFDSAENFSEGLAKISTNKQYAFINKEGRIVSQLFDWIDSFSEGLAMVGINRKSGCIDEKANIVIEPKFNTIEKFSGVLAKITVSQDEEKLEQCGYIDKKGNIIGELFDEISEFSDGLVRVRRNGKYGLIDKNMNTVIKPQFDEFSNTFYGGSSAFSDGLAYIKSNKKYGYINTKGKIIIEPQFDGIGYFIDGLAQIKANEKYDLIDKTGKVILQPEFDKIGKFIDGLAIIQKGKSYSDEKYGLTDKTGKIILQPEFDEITKFTDELALIEKNGKYGYINNIGTIVIEPQFDRANFFRNGKAYVQKKGILGIGGRRGHIDKTGQWIK